MAAVSLRNLEKRFSGGVPAVDGFSLDVGDGELFVLVGPSGCGKTTLLRLIAGLETPTAGVISIGGREVNRLCPRDRDVAMVFQNPTLYPHWNVSRNMAFGLRLRGVSRAESRRRVEAAASWLGIGALLDRRPSALSGGQTQRVALGRAVVRRPEVFLLDEPLVNVDARRRDDLREEVRRLHSDLGATMIWVTHDQHEAMSLGQRIAVMRDGRLEQLDEPMTLYRKPANRFVAAMFGRPPINLISGRIESHDGRLEFRGEGLWIPLDASWAQRLASHVDRTILLGLRPDHLVPDGGPTVDAIARISGRVTAIERFGFESHVRLEVGSSALVTRLAGAYDGRVGHSIALAVGAEYLHFFDADTEKSL